MDLLSYNLNDQEKEYFSRVAESPLYREHPVPKELLRRLSDDFSAFVNIPPNNRSNLFSLYPKGSDIESLLSEDWACARKTGALRLYDPHGDKVNFPLRMVSSNGRPVEVTIAPSTFGSAQMPWYLSFVPVLNHVHPVSALLSDPTPGSRVPREVPAQLTDALDDVAMRDDYRTGHLPEDVKSEVLGIASNFKDSVHLSMRWLQALAELAEPAADLEGLLARDFSYDCAHGLLRYYEGKVLFPVSLLRSDGVTAAEVAMRRDDRPDSDGNKPWVLWGVDSRPRHAVPPRRALERWAYMGYWPDVLESLAASALPESWDFEEDGANGHAILRSYLCYTFYRLQSEGKVLEDREHDIAAFNTGLVNHTYEPIFACFSAQSGSLSWRFEAFCKQGSRQWGKRLVSTFNPLPARAQYFQSKEDLLFDSSRALVLDRDHILLDNIARLPLNFLEDELHGSSEALDILEKLKQTSEPNELDELYVLLREVVDGDSRLMRRLINRLQDSVDLALKRVEWNYRTAIPAFYPTRDTMSLLLPLSLSDDGRPDVALVAELQESGAYLGQTILTMRMAYNNARLVCRPDSDWLNTSVRLAVDTGDELSEDGE